MERGHHWSYKFHFAAFLTLKSQKNICCENGLKITFKWDELLFGLLCSTSANIRTRHLFGVLRNYKETAPARCSTYRELVQYNPWNLCNGKNYHFNEAPGTWICGNLEKEENIYFPETPLFCLFVFKKEKRCVYSSLQSLSIFFIYLLKLKTAPVLFVLFLY